MGMQILVIEGQSEYEKVKEDGNRKRKRRTTAAGSRRRTGDQHHPGEKNRGPCRGWKVRAGQACVDRPYLILIRVLSSLSSLPPR